LGVCNHKTHRDPDLQGDTMMKRAYPDSAGVGVARCFLLAWTFF